MRHNRSSWLTPEIVCPKRRINQLSVVRAQVFETSMKHSDIQTNTKAHVTARLVVGFDLVRHVYQRVTSYRLRQSQGFSSDDPSSPLDAPVVRRSGNCNVHTIGAVNMWSGKPNQAPRCFLLCCRTTSSTFYPDFNRKRRVRECNRSCFLLLNIETKPIAPISSEPKT